MATPRHLARTPIREALVDIRVVPDSPVSAQRFAVLREQLADGYVKVDERRNIRANLSVREGKIVPPIPEYSFGGLWLKTEQDDRIAQFRPDGFTLNQVRTYEGGDAIINEALRLWEIYRNLAGSLVVTRVAMRYINDLKLPIGPDDDFQRFLTEPARLPVQAPQLFSSFLTRVIAHEEPDVVIVTQQMEVTEHGVPPSITIDVEVACHDGLSGDVEVIRAHLNRLRGLKNKVFFSLVTDETVSLYV